MLIRADARSLPLLDACVDCVVTSPPYWGLRDYGVAPSVWGGDPECAHTWGESIKVNATNHTDKRRWNHTRNGRDEEQPVEKRVAWLRTFVDQGCICGECGAWLGKLGLEPSPELFVENIVQVFREVRRVLKPKGTAWVNFGDSYLNPDKGGYQPSRVKAEDSLQRGNLASDFYGAPNRNWQGLPPKNLVGIPWRVAFALQSDGWYLRSDIIWSKPNPMPESVQDRPTRAHEYVFLLAKSERYEYDAAAIREPYAESTLDQFERPYEGLPIKDYAAAGVQNPSDIKRRITDKQRGHSRRHAGFNDRWDAMPKEEQQMGGANKRTVWTIPTKPYSGAHFATMPEKLVEPCILAGCPLGGLVLDPFVGSGTVIAVAQRLGRRGVGVDLNAQYHELAKERTAQRGLSFTQESA